MLYIRSSDLIHDLRFPHSPEPGKHCSNLSYYGLNFLLIYPEIFVLLCLTYCP